MASYIIKAEIVVEGPSILSKKSAINELQVMIDDYVDNNSENGAEISISILSTKKGE